MDCSANLKIDSWAKQTVKPVPPAPGNLLKILGYQVIFC